MAVWLRRILRLAVVGALGAVVTTWFRNRVPTVDDQRTPGNAAWPPLRPLAEPTDGSPAEPLDTAAPAMTTVSAATATWVMPSEDGSCPLSHPVKVKESSGIFHVPDGAAYPRTLPDRCYRNADDAAADGFRASKI